MHSKLPHMKQLRRADSGGRSGVEEQGDKRGNCDETSNAIKTKLARQTKVLKSAQQMNVIL